MHRTTFENYVSLKVKAMQVYLKIRKTYSLNPNIFNYVQLLKA